MNLSVAFPLPEDPPGNQMSDFRSIYDAHLALVLRTLRRFGVEEPALDDAVQDVFTVVHTKLSGFEGRSSLKSWIFGIARRVARNYRGGGREEPAEFDLHHHLDKRSADRSQSEKIDSARTLYRLLGQLSAEHREIFLLVELEQFTMREASEALGVNANTLASRHRRARQELQALLVQVDQSDNGRAGCEI